LNIRLKSLDFLSADYQILMQFQLTFIVYLHSKNAMLNYKNIKSERQWKAVVGLSFLQFDKLCKEFGLIFEKIYQLTITELSSNLNSEFLLMKPVHFSYYFLLCKKS